MQESPENWNIHDPPVPFSREVRLKNHVYIGHRPGASENPDERFYRDSEWIEESGEERYLMELYPFATGGMGDIHLGFDRKIGKYIVIKKISFDLLYEDYFQLFEREARCMAKLAHPCIVGIHDFIKRDNQVYILQEYMDPDIFPTLNHLLDLHGANATYMSVEDVIRVTSCVANGLDYMADNGVLHRDVKPGNIFVPSEGEARISDFGLAASLQNGEYMPSERFKIGTPGYMSPEATNGDKLQRQSDVYSLAICVYEMLTNEYLFTSDTTQQMLDQSAHEQFPALLVHPSLRRFDPEVVMKLDAVFLRAFALDPQERYPTATAFALALARALGAK